MAYISFKPTDFFNTILYTGDDGASQAQTGVGFSADLTWIKDRDSTEEHVLTDTVRGATYWIRSNATNANAALATGLLSWQSDGFTVGNNGVVGTTDDYVAWNWKAGTTTGLDFSAGDITPSAYSVNTTSGIGIYKYTGDGTVGGDTIAHNLGATPKLVIVKQLTDAYSWAVQHSSVANTKILNLDKVDASSTNDAFHNTYPTSTLITLGSSTYTNAAAGTKDYIMYAFAPVTGYSHFTQYLGNGDTVGMFINTGFEPAFLMIKETDSSSGWCMYDNKRPDSNPGYWNVNSNFLQAQETGVESNNANLSVDFLSNGFKVRNAAGDINGSGNHYSVMAFAKNPIIGQGGTPGVAR
jgi:hypothetical protein